MQKRYNAVEIIKAAEIAEVSTNDAMKIISKLGEARNIIFKKYNCNNCLNGFRDCFEDLSCNHKYQIKFEEHCGGYHYYPKTK